MNATPPASADAPRLANGRPACARCRRPLPACLCGFVVPTANRLRLLVLQHPQEARHAKNSVRLLRLSLAACRVEVGTVFDPGALAAWLGQDGDRGTAASLLLFPAAPTWPGASPRTPDTSGTIDSAAPPAQLVLLDGTWRQARALLRDNPLLQRLPRWSLTDPPPSRYAIRRAQRPPQRSTLEAACLALGQLEGRPAAYAPLLAAFDGWVASVAARRPGGAPSPA